MTLVFRFISKNGFIQEHFFDFCTCERHYIIGLCSILSQHGLDVSNIYGQRYGGASNMRGEWNGL